MQRRSEKNRLSWVSQGEGTPRKDQRELTANLLTRPACPARLSCDRSRVTQQVHWGKGFICVTREFIMGYLLFFNVMFFFTFEAVFYAFDRKSRRVHSRSPSCQAIQSPPRDSIVNGLSRFFPETRGANTSMCMYAFFSFFQTGAQYTYSSMIVS